MKNKCDFHNFYHEQEPKLINTQKVADNKGVTRIFESNKLIPFEIRRVFTISHVSDCFERGNHANRKSSFVLTCIKGSLEVTVFKGQHKFVYNLTDSTSSLYIPKMTWKIMSEFTIDTVLLVLSDTFYDKKEYINEFTEYLHEFEKGVDQFE